MKPELLNGNDTAKNLREKTPVEQLARNLKVFSVYDKKSAAYAPPFFYHHKGQALRAFEDAVNDANSPLHKHPEDFSLFLLGEWNEVSGVLLPLTNPEHIEEALSVLK